ncbi:Non-specific serine/threonine protein kinase [Purpureocillium takamizusanense]|uniref:non-specific serine/threonine protein kinase n=1 Tax=Purpureocillium takamizusanense TaxID=2060973 RepID=A0A9Q8QLC8_9HYPO|nr:Non-specific serine/threonine protein kinase [Purpureocillium takamizusanense]UNI21342.1 Non-specific serine/threonine protein kinase [Purpureocillium takamizusanense]
MSAYGHQQMASHPGQRHHHGGGGHGPVMAAPGVVAPAGTFSPGTKIQVGSHRVVIQKYLSEGGFAHVYVVKMPKPVDGTDVAVLKRVAVPDKEALRSMRTEVETMKRLKGHRPIVTYIDSHASEMRGGGGYEVFLLMEYCNGGGLIDFMNTRLQHRLTEPEIINIFADIAEGVACMHYLKPPLLHRDIKVENVLITSKGSSKRFKLCDFGSAAPPRPAPTTVVECRQMDEDVQKHTTLQYRSPEMIDVYRKQPLNEKSDIWALGVLLYKLCYYTTPFEDQGQLAILNASFRYPSHPIFSDRLKKLIASMLREKLDDRPTIYQVLKEACSMQGRQVPIQDIYTGRSNTESRSGQRTSRELKPKSQAVGAVYSPPVQEQQAIPNVVPMRRGRPTPSPGPTSSTQKPNSSPQKVTEGDPFAALDSKSTQKLEGDELSSKFPTLDQFSLLHDHGSKFNFDSSTASPPPPVPAKDPNNRLAEKLADAAFASSRNSPANTMPTVRPHSVTPTIPRQALTSPPIDRPPSSSSTARHQADVSKAQSIISSNPDLQAISGQAASKYVSTGTMTTDLSPSTSRPAELGTTQRSTESKQSSTLHRPAHLRRPSLSSRPSLEDNRAQATKAESAMRSNAFAGRPRPASTNFESSTLEFLRDREASKAQGRMDRTSSNGSSHKPMSSVSAIPRSSNDQKVTAHSGPLIDADGSDSDGLRADVVSKRSSLPPSPAPKKLAGKFGDAFQRFESTSPANNGLGQRAASPLKETARRDLTPIAGSEITDDRSDDGLIDLDDDMTPEMRRDAERRKLEEEERRVAAAQREYKNRVAGGSSKPVPGPKKASIQSRVQSLLDEDQRRPSHVQRTAEGYGKYSDAATAASKVEKPTPAVPRKPLTISRAVVDARAHDTRSEPLSRVQSAGAASAPATIDSRATGSKPAAPKKPGHLNKFATGARPPSPVKSTQPSQLERLIAADLPGQPVLEMSAQEKDDYIEDFAKRFPSLSKMEMDAVSGGGSGAVRR